ncbi:glycosyltransferase [Starkeya koreensis]|uniref:Glycosyltransferase n=2 Tax=Ancylobacter koreensis TaxID=266121 RepID=A0ABT0DGY9_9HYPH|nr:glycosyltransferase [Ancylobacter koreensis]
MPSYRHEAYIAEAIGSVLGQSVRDIELIVIDDASPDGSNAVIGRFDDPRLVHIPLTSNVGASAAMNVGLRRARAPFIAVCNSDDAWEPDKLERQLAILDRSPEIAAVFTDVSWVDAAGAPMDRAVPGALGNFAWENGTRHVWLKRLAEEGNCLCHPSVLLRREVYESCGAYDDYLRQLPDYDMWLRLLQKHEIHVLADRLVRFRVHDRNTSGGASEVRRRDAREGLFILRRFFEEIDAGDFAAAFLGGELSGAATAASPDPRELLRYLLAHEGHRRGLFREIALEAIFRAPPDIRQDAMSVAAFQRAMGDAMPRPDRKRGLMSRLYGVFASLGR